MRRANLQGKDGSEGTSQGRLVRAGSRVKAKGADGGSSRGREKSEGVGGGERCGGKETREKRKEAVCYM